MPDPTILPTGLIQVKELLQSTLDAQEDLPDSFDLDQWLQDWLRRPQPVLGGARPVDHLNTPGGIEAVGRVLGALASGTYQ